MDKLIVILPSLNIKYCETTFVVFSARFSIYPTSGMDLMALLSSYFLLLLSTSSFIWGCGNGNTAIFHREIFEKSHVIHHNTSKGAWIRGIHIPSIELNSNNLKAFFDICIKLNKYVVLMSTRGLTS